MTMAAAMPGHTAEPRESRIVSLDIIEDIAEAETLWRGLEDPHHFSTPFQRFDLLKPWQQWIGSREGSHPFIVVARDANRAPLVLLPLCLRSRAGLRAASFMGGRHTSFNMGLWERDFALNARGDDMQALLAPLARCGRVDLLALRQQPLSWHGLPNPLALLPRQNAINTCPFLIMPEGAPPAAAISASQRRRLRSKERRFEALSGYRYYVATDDQDISRLLTWFFAVKRQRMARQKLPDVFGQAGVAGFIGAACRTPCGSGRVIELHVLECDAEVLALCGGVSDRQRLSLMFNTYTLSENAHFSPGLVLMRNIIDAWAARGPGTIDLGTGAGDYKRLFCKDEEVTVDSFVPLTTRGRLAAQTLSALGHVIRGVKQNRILFDLARRFRHAFC